MSEDLAKECHHCNRHILIWKLLDLAEVLIMLDREKKITRFGGMGADIYNGQLNKALSMARTIKRMWGSE
jgi:hypothetical protein